MSAKHITAIRPSQYLVVDPGTSTTEQQADYTYRSDDGRLQTVQDNSNTARTFTYNYTSSSYHLLGSVVGPVHTVTNTYETNRDILTVKENEETVGTASTPSQYTYVTNTIGQRSSVARSGLSMSVANTIGWDYNTRGEVTEEDFNNNGTADARDRVYGFDVIGNREKTAEGTLTLPGTTNYAANSLNEYTSVNTNGTAVVPVYDNSGNMTSGQVPAHLGNSSTLTWDAENRLVKAVVDGVTITFEYDYMGRRIGKKVGTATPTRYLYNGWNLCAEYNGTTLDKVYTWGMDLSGSMQGAGGVGGLLMVAEQAGASVSEYYPTYDGNGNVSEYLDSAGSTAAHYEYDAFGNDAITPTGSKAGDFAHRFSTKYLDDETGLYYYGYRYYDPVTGRWPSRDPIEERGGMNLYGFVFNIPIGWIDVLGLWPTPPGINIDVWTRHRQKSKDQINRRRRKRDPNIQDRVQDTYPRPLPSKKEPLSVTVSLLFPWFEGECEEGEVFFQPEVTLKDPFELESPVPDPVQDGYDWTDRAAMFSTLANSIANSAPGRVIGGADTIANRAKSYAQIFGSFGVSREVSIKAKYRCCKCNLITSGGVTGFRHEWGPEKEMGPELVKMDNGLTIFNQYQVAEALQWTAVWINSMKAMAEADCAKQNGSEK